MGTTVYPFLFFGILFKNREEFPWVHYPSEASVEKEYGPDDFDAWCRDTHDPSENGILKPGSHGWGEFPEGYLSISESFKLCEPGEGISVCVEPSVTIEYEKKFRDFYEKSGWQWPEPGRVGWWVVVAYFA